MTPKLPSPGELEAVWEAKYGPRHDMGWAPTRRHRFGYYLPADVYETVVAGLVSEGTRWLDVGGGQVMFAHNPGLARTLAARARRVVACDPSDNVRRNRFAHEVAQCRIEDYRPDGSFDLATLRMVVEHVDDPWQFVRALARLIRPGGLAVVFTVDRGSPTAMISRVVPFRLHHAVKRVFWDGEEADTFPAFYRMNRQAHLRNYFTGAGFEEALAVRLDDLSVFSAFKALSYLELLVWQGFRALRLPYPEGCLLAVYRRRSGG